MADPARDRCSCLASAPPEIPDHVAAACDDAWGRVGYVLLLEAVNDPQPQPVEAPKMSLSPEEEAQRDHRYRVLLDALTLASVYADEELSFHIDDLAEQVKDRLDTRIHQEDPQL